MPTQTLPMQVLHFRATHVNTYFLYILLIAAKLKPIEYAVNMLT